MDDDQSRSIDIKEFEKALKEFGLVEIGKSEMLDIFGKFDRDNSGSIDFDEFLFSLRVTNVACK